MAYHTVLWPFWGFLLMPYTTLAYMAAMLQNHHELSGGWIVLVVIAVSLSTWAARGGPQDQFTPRKG